MSKISLLHKLFSENRAEWPPEQFKQLFVPPIYLDKLESVRPCFLVGGRGTGKTTSLQSLRYDATLERLKDHDLGFDDQEYLGILVRINKNRVHAFQGGGISQEDLNRSFAHYFNLLACLELTNLALWLENQNNAKFSSSYIHRICVDLGIDKQDSLDALKNEIKINISELQIYINNPQKNNPIILSIAEAPLRTFVEGLEESSLLGTRTVFCCIDEYENLLDYQQAILNTYIKHAEPPLSYKIGVRKNGLRNRQTLDGQDLLKTPDDYADIEIANEGFDYFARAVAEARLACAQQSGINVTPNLDNFLEDLSFADEAKKLGAEKIASEVIDELRNLDPECFSFFQNKPDHEVYFLKYWQVSEGGQLIDLAKNWISDESTWKTRLGNHGYASLFWLSNGNKGARIKKYYCGSRVFLTLPSGNIRFFLELLDASIKREIEAGYQFSNALFISAKSQTLATKDVGRRRLDQLEGLADNGVQLKRLVLAIGKVFFEFARSPVGRAPEVTSFIVNGNPDDLRKIRKLLSEGVGHLAFEVEPRTKATSSSEIKDDEYRLHKIFCGFFEISHRRKRRTTFEAKDLLRIFNDTPSKAISSLLGDIEQTEEKDLPEQLAFFNAFYDAGENRE